MELNVEQFSSTVKTLLHYSADPDALKLSEWPLQLIQEHE